MKRKHPPDIDVGEVHAGLAAIDPLSERLAAPPAEWAYPELIVRDEPVSAL